MAMIFMDGFEYYSEAERQAFRKLALFEDEHPELREIWRTQGAMAYHIALQKILRNERDKVLDAEIIFEDLLDAETVE